MQVGAGDILNAIPQPALLIGADDRVAAVNSGAEALLGAGIAGRHFVTVLRRPAILDAIEAVQSGKDNAEATYLTGAGDEDRSYDVSCRPVALESGRGVLAVFRDVSDKEAAGRIRRDFVANVSHELRTPLTALIGFIETLAGPARDDAAARERFLAIMAQEAQRMNRLVGDLLSLSRVEADERVRPTEMVDLAGLVTQSLGRLRPLADEAGVQLEMSVPEAGALMVPGDADQLSQVLTNLVENAIKYGGEGGQVDVLLHPPRHEPGLRGDAVRLEVRDHGAGIDPLHLPRLTERFYRVDTHRSREKGGTGLGLAIVKHIVGRHRGRLRIDSRPGQGTVVSVLLPV